LLLFAPAVGIEPTSN